MPAIQTIIEKINQSKCEMTSQISHKNTNQITHNLTANHDHDHDLTPFINIFLMYVCHQFLKYSMLK